MDFLPTADVIISSHVKSLIFAILLRRLQNTRLHTAPQLVFSKRQNPIIGWCKVCLARTLCALKIPGKEG